MNTFEVLYFITGMAFICNGVALKYFPPKRMSVWGRGVVTAEAMKNRETWNEANRFFSVPQMIIGLIYFAFVAASAMKYISLTTSNFAGLGLSIALILRAMLKMHLAKHFDENGNPKR